MIANTGIKFLDKNFEGTGLMDGILDHMQGDDEIPQPGGRNVRPHLKVHSDGRNGISFNFCELEKRERLSPEWGQVQQAKHSEGKSPPGKKY